VSLGRLVGPVVAVLVAAIIAAVVVAEDVVEFANGAKLNGRVVGRNATSITVETKVGDRTYSRQYPIEKVRSITTDGKVELLGLPPGAGPAAPGSGESQRTPEEVQTLIESVGRQTPDWFESTPLDYPRSLDLSWPEPSPSREWNNQRNVGQYYWDIINPNPGKWKSGIRLAHHLLVVNKDQPQTRQRVMLQLGRMYHDLLQDYARAAFWWQHAGVDRSRDASLAGVHLAECYWRLGSKPMALDLLAKMPPHFATIKLWADMGETDRALQLAEANVRGAFGDIACLYAGDACRMAEQYPKALQYYEQVLRMPASGRAAKRIQANQERARANIEGIRLYELLDIRRVPDGTYRAQSLGYKAPVHVAVTVRGGRIESVEVTQHEEKQFYSALTDTPKKIIARQGVKGVDATSSATMTSEAIINATAKALADAMR